MLSCSLLTTKTCRSSSFGDELLLIVFIVWDELDIFTFVVYALNGAQAVLCYDGIYFAAN